MCLLPADIPAVPVKKSCAGFTLVEVVVAVGLALIVIDLSFLAFNSISKYWRDWQDQEKAVRTLHLMNLYLNQDIMQADWIQSISDSEMVLSRYNKTVVHYQYRKGYVTRNSMNMNLQPVKICFKAKVDNADSLSTVNNFSLLSAGSMAMQQITGISFFAQLTDRRGKKYVLESVVYLRNPGIGKYF